MKNGISAKRIIGGVLALGMVFSMFGCSGSYDVSDNEYFRETSERFESYNIVPDDAVNTDTFFAKRQCSYEFDDKELNGAIDKILAVKMNPANSEFESIDYNKDISESIAALVKTNQYRSKVTFDANYSWLNDGKIDKAKLRERIESHTRAYNRNRLSKNNQKSIDVFMDVIEDYLAYIKSYVPDYDLSKFYESIDLLVFEESDDEGICGEYGGECISINHKNTFDDFFYSVMAHEMTHMLLSQTLNYTDVNISGLWIQGSFSSNTEVFGMRFLEEYICEKVAYAVNKIPESENSTLEREFFIKFCSGLGCTEDELVKVYFSCDHNKLIDLFEPEMQNVNYVISTTASFSNAFESSGSWASADENASDFYCFGMTNIFRDFCIRNLKEVYSGKMNKGEFDKQTDDFIKNAAFENSSECKIGVTAFNAAAKQIKEICDEYISQK